MPKFETWLDCKKCLLICFCYFFSNSCLWWICNIILSLFYWSILVNDSCCTGWDKRLDFTLDDCHVLRYFTPNLFWISLVVWLLYLCKSILGKVLKFSKIFKKCNDFLSFLVGSNLCHVVSLVLDGVSCKRFANFCEFHQNAYVSIVQFNSILVKCSVLSVVKVWQMLGFSILACFSKEHVHFLIFSKLSWTI